MTEMCFPCSIKWSKRKGTGLAECFGIWAYGSSRTACFLCGYWSFNFCSCVQGPDRIASFHGYAAWAWSSLDSHRCYSFWRIRKAKVKSTTGFITDWHSRSPFLPWNPFICEQVYMQTMHGFSGSMFVLCAYNLSRINFTLNFVSCQDLGFWLMFLSLTSDLYSSSFCKYSVPPFYIFSHEKSIVPLELWKVEGCGFLGYNNFE